MTASYHTRVLLDGADHLVALAGQAGPSWANQARLALMDAAEELRDYAKQNAQPAALADRVQQELVAVDSDLHQQFGPDETAWTVEQRHAYETATSRIFTHYTAEVNGHVAA